MNPEPPDPLAAALHRELHRLPLHRAPADLMPRVLAALAATERRAWWERSWFEWPRAMRQLSGLAALLAVAALVGITQLLRHFDTLAGTAADAFGLASSLGQALAVLAHSVPFDALLAGGVLVVASYLCAIALGTAFFRYALPRRDSHS